MAAYGCCGEYNEHVPNCAYVRSIAHIAGLEAEAQALREERDAYLEILMDIYKNYQSHPNLDLKIKRVLARFKKGEKV